MSAYEELLTRLKDIDLIRQIGSLLSWDQEVLMPPKAAPLRAEQLAWISKTAHERLTDARIGEILDEIESNDDMDALHRRISGLRGRLLTGQRNCLQSSSKRWRSIVPGL